MSKNKGQNYSKEFLLGIAELEATKVWKPDSPEGKTFGLE